MGKWYDTGFKEAVDGLPSDPPMQPGHRSHSDYVDGYRDGQLQNRVAAENDVAEDDAPSPTRRPRL